MIHKQIFIAIAIALGALLAFGVGAQEAPPAPPIEKKPAEQTAPPAASDKPAAPKGSAKDRLDLDSTSITGNRELPKVLYIVPWKKSGLGDLPGRPSNSLLDEVLAPVDRDVFRRQTDYFTALDEHAKAEQNSAAPLSSSPSAQKSEK